jgi:hypothetical protein
MLHMQYCLVAAVIQIQFLHSQICIYTYIHTYHVLHNIEILVMQKNLKKLWTAVNAACQGNLSACHRFTSPELGYGLNNTGSSPGWGRSCVSGKYPDWLWVLASLVFNGYQVLFWWHDVARALN